MSLNKKDREFIAEGLAGVTFYEMQRVLDGSAFTESGRTPTGKSKAECALAVKEDAERRLDLINFSLSAAGSDFGPYNRIYGFIKQLDEFIAANTPAEVG